MFYVVFTLVWGVMSTPRGTGRAGGVCGGWAEAGGGLGEVWWVSYDIEVFLPSQGCFVHLLGC